MSDLSAVLIMLAVFTAAGICTSLFWSRAHKRCDEIATGIANGHPVPPTYRSLLLYCDYVTHGFAISGILLTLGLGYFVTAGLVGDPNAKLLASVCALFCIVAAAGNTAFAAVWVVHLRSILRRAEAD
jgi:hypothetical protein